MISPITRKERGQTALALVPLDPVPPPAREDKARLLAERFLAARHMRLHGWSADKTPRPPSPGMLKDVTERMVVLLREGFEPDLLVSLPALVDEAALDFMLRKDPLVLLRTDNPQGGKCHARRYEGQLPGMRLGDRQLAILRNIGTAEYVRSRGASAKW